MARYNFFVFSNCTDSAREGEFNRWYTHIHIPDLSLAKGFVSARRYVNLEPDTQAKFLAIYEFETENIDESIQSLYDLAAAAWPKGRHIDCIEAGTQISLPVVTFQEIDPQTLEPLEDVNYPTEMSEAVRASFARE